MVFIIIIIKKKKAPHNAQKWAEKLMSRFYHVCLLYYNTRQANDRWAKTNFKKIKKTRVAIKYGGGMRIFDYAADSSCFHVDTTFTVIWHQGYRKEDTLLRFEIKRPPPHPLLFCCSLLLLFLYFFRPPVPSRVPFWPVGWLLLSCVRTCRIKDKRSVANQGGVQMPILPFCL